MDDPGFYPGPRQIHPRCPRGPCSKRLRTSFGHEGQQVTSLALECYVGPNSEPRSEFPTSDVKSQTQTAAVAAPMSRYKVSSTFPLVIKRTWSQKDNGDLPRNPISLGRQRLLQIPAAHQEQHLLVQSSLLELSRLVGETRFTQ